MKKSLLILLCSSLLCASSFCAVAERKEAVDKDDTQSEQNPYTQHIHSSLREEIETPIEDKIVYTDKKTGQKLTVSLQKYHPRTYLLAYNVFIMSGEPAYAFKLARIAVQHEPENIEWRMRLAQSAMWSGNAFVTLEQWMYFIKHNIDTGQYDQKALVLASQLQDYDAQAHILHTMLQRTPDNQTLFLNYLIALQKQGFPTAALHLLKKIPDATKNPYYLEQMVNITSGTDQPEQEFLYLEKLSALQRKNLKILMKEAEILYSKGKLQSAFQHYQKAVPHATNSDREFWQSYGDIAYLTGHIATAALAYKTLLQGGDVHPSSVGMLMNLEQMLGHQKAAYAYAKQGFELTGDIRYAKNILSLGINLEKSEEVQIYLKRLTPQQMLELRNDINYAPIIANMYWQSGHKMKAWREWQRILGRWTNNTQAQSDFLWMLIDNHLYKQLLFVLERWCKIFENKPILWNVHASMYTKTGDYLSAFTIMKQHWQEMNRDYINLLSMADLFSQNNNSYAAYFIQRKAMVLLLDQLIKNPASITLSQHLALSELTRRFSSAEIAAHVVMRLAPDLFTNSAVDEQIVGWALEQRRYSLARQIIRRRTLAGKHISPWMQLTLAQEEMDREPMQSLLQKVPTLLPYRDRVTAASITGNLKLAEEYAYQGLRDHPNDQEMYKLFIDTMLPRANKISTGIKKQAYGNVVGPIAQAHARFFITPSLALTPYAKAWFPHTTDPAVIAPPPSNVQNTGIRLRKTVERGWIEGSVARMRGLETVYPIKMKWHRNHVLPDLSVDMGLAYHEEADQSSALLIGGMQNDANLAMNYIYDSYNYLDGEARFLEFYGQDSWKLGTGQELRGHWQHKFYASPPDWNTNLYGSWLSYQDKRRPLSPVLQKLVPAGGFPGVAFYMPVNNLEVGFTLGVNQQFREEYTRDWKVFGEGGLLYSKAFGLGKIIQGGIATSIFGRDHLILFGEYSVNQQQISQAQLNQSQAGQASQIFYVIGINYEYYF